MKMFRLLTGMIALFMIALAGCSNQSPDFTPVLKTITISPNPAPTVALGNTQQFTATGTCTTPPNSAGVQGTGPCSPKVSWSTSNPSVGTISNTGLFTSVSQGTTDVTASAEGKTGTVTVTVGAPVIKTLVVTPATASIGQESTQNYLVQATYSDTAGVAITVRSGDTIEWASYIPGSTTPSTIATVNPATGTTTTATSATTAGTATITACSPTCVSASKITGTATLTVTNQRLIGLTADQKLVPPAQTVPAGVDSLPYQMIGTYSDGTNTTTGPIPNSQIDWTITPADGSIATLNTVDPVGNSVTAHAVALGLATIKGTLKAGVAPSITDPTKRFETGTLTVLQGYCTAPYAAPAATTTTTLDPLCLGGLLCSVGSPGNVIDNDPATFATLNSTVGLLFSGVTLTINSGAAAQPGGTTVGFVIARPAGLLLSAEVLSQFTVTTLLGTTVQDTFNTPASTTLPPLLRLTLLGAIGGVDQVLVSFDTTAGKSYDGLSIRFNPGVASALETTNVYSACAAIDKTKLPTP